MKEKLLSQGKKTKKKKPRMAVIEGPYVHPPGKEIRPKFDAEIIIDLEASIQEALKSLNRFTHTQPKVIELNLQAIKLYPFISKEVELSYFPLKEVDKKIRLAKSSDDKKNIIELLTEKEQLLIAILSKIQHSMATIEELEAEAYPKEIDKERFFEEYHLILDEVTKIYQQYKSKEEYVKQNGVGESVLSKLKVIREEIVFHVVTYHRQVCEEFKANPQIVTSDQYARIINAKNNLDLLAQRFYLVNNSFEENVAYETKLKKVTLQSLMLNSAFKQLTNISDRNNPLVIKLNETLCDEDGLFKITFNEQDFLLTSDKLLPPKKSLDVKGQEINSAYVAVLNAIEEYKSSFDFKIPIKQITDRAAVITAIGYISSLNVERIKQAITYAFDPLIKPEEELEKLIPLKKLSVEVLQENQQIKTYIEQWIIDYPELILFNQGQKTFLYKNHEYLMTSSASEYANSREQLLKALIDGDEKGMDYERIYSIFITAKAALNTYIEEQKKLEPQRKLIATLLDELERTIHPIPIIYIEPNIMDPLLETDRYFLKEFIKIRADVNSIKNSMCIEKIIINNQLLAKYTLDFKEQLILYNDFKHLFKKLDQVMVFIKSVFDKIYHEKTRIIDIFGISDARLDILQALEESFVITDNAIRALYKSLKNLICTSNDGTQAKLWDITNKIDKEQMEGVERIRIIISGEQLNRLPIIRYNPLIAWIIKLINPLLTLEIEEKSNKRNGFFDKKMELVNNFAENTSPNVGRILTPRSSCSD